MALWRQFTTWIGGVGIIVMFLAVLPRLRVGGRQALFKTEMPGPEMPLATNFALLFVGIARRRVRMLAGDEEVRAGACCCWRRRSSWSPGC